MRGSSSTNRILIVLDKKSARPALQMSNSCQCHISGAACRSNSEIPCQHGSIDMRSGAVKWIYPGNQFPWDPACLFLIQEIKRWVVMLMINVSPNPISHGAAHQHVRKKMLAPGVARNSYRSGQRVGAIANSRMARAILFRNHRRDGPRANSMPGRKRRAAVKKFSTRIIDWRTLPLRSDL